MRWLKTKSPVVRESYKDNCMELWICVRERKQGILSEKCEFWGFERKACEIYSEMGFLKKWRGWFRV